MIKLVKIIISIAIIAALGFWGYNYWLHQQAFPSTDDAYISAHVVNISPEINGKIVQTFVKNQQQVKAGTILFKIDPSNYKLKLVQAKADLQNTKELIRSNQNSVTNAAAVVTERIGQLKTQQRSTARVEDLVKQKLLSPQDHDNSLSQLKSATLAVAQAKSSLANSQAALGDAAAEIQTKQAAIAQAQLDLAHTTVQAPATGHIENFSLRVGDTVNAYQEVFAIVEDNDFWVSANFKETDIAKLQAGQSASISIDMYPDQKFTGKVLSISTGSGTSFSLLPPENASGNWVKVTQRFPVKVSIDTPNSKYPLRLGASATVTIDASGRKE